MHLCFDCVCDGKLWPCRQKLVKKIEKSEKKRGYSAKKVKIFPEELMLKNKTFLYQDVQIRNFYTGR